MKLLAWLFGIFVVFIFFTSVEVSADSADLIAVSPYLQEETQRPAEPAQTAQVSPQTSFSISKMKTWTKIAESDPWTVPNDSCGHNVWVALDAQSGQPRSSFVAAGETFSFNAAVGNPTEVNYVTAYGVPGGCWCDLAARYMQAAERAGAQLVEGTHYIHHGIQLNGVSWRHSIAIWNKGLGPGQHSGQQDLLIPVGDDTLFLVSEEGNTITVEVYQ